MKSIGEFFKRIQNLHAREIGARMEICRAVKKHAGIDLRHEDISFKAGVVQLKGISLAAKSQIFIKKEAIIKEIDLAQTGGKAVSDIR